MAQQWLSMVGAIWLQTINGTNSDFPAYSSQLKQLISISQLQLNNLAVASDAGKLFGWFSGLAALHLPLWSLLLVGSVLGLIGYGLQYLFLTDQISLSYNQLLFLTLLAGTSICWINTVCYTVLIQNFKLDRLIAVGLATSYISLSAKIYTDVVNYAFPSSPIERARGYLLLNSVLPLGVCLLAMPIVRVLKIENSRRIEGGFVELFGVTIVTGIYAVISSLGNFSRFLSLMGMGVLVLVPVVIPLGEKVRERLEKKCWLRRESRRVHNELRVEEEEEEVEGNLENGGVRVEEEGYINRNHPLLRTNSILLFL